MPTQSTPPTAAASAASFGAAVGDSLRALSGLSVPMAELAALQSEYMQSAGEIWNRALQPAQAAAPAIGDRRFASSEWLASPASAYTAQMYLLNARMLLKMADAMEGDERTRAKVRFAVQQWIDAASPSNILAFNPDALKKAIDSNGQSIAQGMQQLFADLQRGRVSQTDESMFEVGRNVATTEGSVVFENDFFQLLEYAPLTAKVHARPMLFVPPCINKYYILDLQPSNSVIRHTVEAGHRTFVVSWRNPDAAMAAATWDDYIEQGAITAIRTVQQVARAETINTLGFCVGGTILATALAVLAARGARTGEDGARESHPAASLTLLTTLLDFESTGILDVFIDEPSVQMRELTIGEGAPGGPGLLRGQELATTFSFLRPNDLVWNYVVGNYLKGEAPPPFDLLYWNGDSTNLPGPMFCWYLRHMYLQNELKQPGKLTVCGERVDLGAIRAPAFVYGSRDDHIVPWTAAYASMPLLKGAERMFVVGASGHIAGVINPPAAKKRSHWVNRGAESARPPATAEAWFEGAEEVPGSWWGEWMGWLKPYGGKLVAAPKIAGDADHPPIEPAPGRYVKAKA